MKQFIKNLKPGERIESVFFLKKKEIKRTKDNKPYLAIVLGDKSGVIEGKRWDADEAFSQALDTGRAVFVKGMVNVFKDNTQVIAEDIRYAEPDEYTSQDLMRSVENIDEIMGSIKKLLDGIENKWIKKLVSNFLNDKDFMIKFKISPGAQNWHNAYIGGLAEHTYEVMAIANKICDMYPEADRDICIIGGFLHDVGKVYELDPNTFEQTLGGGLIGHLPLGFELVSKKISEVPDFPDELALHIKHGVLSHHGEYEQQSPILPKTLEGTIVYQCDELVSQANAIKELIAREKGMRKTWSNFVSIKNRKYLLTKPGKDEK